jgi:hypothetical protein
MTRLRKQVANFYMNLITDERYHFHGFEVHSVYYSTTGLVG